MSDKNMDDLLAQLEAEFEPSNRARANGQNSQSAQVKSPQNSQSNASMDKMLDELRAELESGRGRPNSTPESIASPKPSKADVVSGAQKRDRLNALIDTDYRRQAHKRDEKLAEIRRKEEAKIAEQKRQEAARIAEQKRHEQDLLEIKQREELREKRRKEALREKAKEWLKNLNPRSEEGKWFEEFSYSYEDKLKAAIDYLDAMRESGL